MNLFVCVTSIKSSPDWTIITESSNITHLNKCQEKIFQNEYHLVSIKLTLLGCCDRISPSTQSAGRLLSKSYTCSFFLHFCQLFITLCCYGFLCYVPLSLSFPKDDDFCHCQSVLFQRQFLCVMLLRLSLCFSPLPSAPATPL